jgi:hypothetical protein
LALPCGRRRKKPGHRGKITRASYLGSKGKKQLRIRAWMYFQAKKVVGYLGFELSCLHNNFKRGGIGHCSVKATVLFFDG